MRWLLINAAYEEATCKGSLIWNILKRSNFNEGCLRENLIKANFLSLEELRVLGIMLRKGINNSFRAYREDQEKYVNNRQTIYKEEYFKQHAQVDIKELYHSLVKRYHPDIAKAEDKNKYTKIMQEINKAYARKDMKTLMKYN